MVAKNDESKPHSRLVNTVGSPFFTSSWIRNKHIVAMEILEANAVPLSYDPPTPDEKMKSKELEAYLR